MKKVINVKGMSCNHCKVAVEKAAKSVAGISAAAVDLAAQTLTIDTDD